MSPAPLYEQIKQHITDLIETGELGPNDRLPSETDLAAEFQVARMTVHRAIKELKDSGVVTRIAGVGTFVAETQSSGQLIAVNNIADERRWWRRRLLAFFGFFLKKFSVSSGGCQVAALAKFESVKSTFPEVDW